MKRLNAIVLIVAGFTLAGCSRAPESELDKDPITGIWIGDFGPAFYDRNTISLELQWDGSSLKGTIQPGVPGARMYKNFASFPIENASFDPKTRTVRFEATYQPRGRRYIIEGKVSRNTLSGTWRRPEENKDGDFKLIRKGT
jgi:hypothetical protein